MVEPGKRLRFEATVHPGDRDVPLESVADLDLEFARGDGERLDRARPR
jgi:hypothetical protein